jgi:uncharacterized protein (DUF1800 family)
MRRQNELLRSLGRKPFGELLMAMVHDPALLLWLDAPDNRREHPNENLARELMELFSLGIGPYTEKDVKEGARALTGWTVADGKFRVESARHDGGPKTILGHSGTWKGDDFVRFVLEHPATSERLAWRLCELFLGEGAIDSAGINALAAGLRAHNLDIGWGVETVLRSQAFFAAANLGNRVLGPVEFVVGSARALELFDTPPSTLLLADWAGRLGLELFYPPNVGGWPGGRAWINTQSMIGRANFVLALVEGQLSRRGEPFDALALGTCHGHGGGLEEVLAFFGQLLEGAAPSPARRGRLLAAVRSRAAATPATARRAVALMLAAPEYHLA